MVGLNSANSVLMLDPKFSILIMVEEVIIFTFCGTKPNVSLDGWADAYCMHPDIIKKEMAFFTALDFGNTDVK